MSIIRNLAKKIYMQIKWGKINKHNFTKPGNYFNPNIIKIGTGTYGTINVVAPNYLDRIHIGNYVSIAENVHFVCGTHDIKRISTYPFQTKVYLSKSANQNERNIVVGDDVWIGYGATILSNVTIGQGAVIAAHSVVTKDVPPYAIFINHKPIRYRFSPEIIEKLMQIDFSKIKHYKGDSFERYSQVHITEENVDEVIKCFIED